MPPFQVIIFRSDDSVGSFSPPPVFVGLPEPPPAAQILNGDFGGAAGVGGIRSGFDVCRGPGASRLRLFYTGTEYRDGRPFRVDTAGRNTRQDVTPGVPPLTGGEALWYDFPVPGKWF